MTERLSKAESNRQVTAFLELIKSEITQGNDIQFVGYFSTEVKNRAERKAKNLQTGEELIIPAHRSPTIKPAKNLKELVK